LGNASWVPHRDRRGAFAPARDFLRIQARRAELGVDRVSAEQLAERLETAVQNVRRIEAGQNITLRTLARVASALGFKVEIRFVAPLRGGIVIHPKRRTAALEWISTATSRSRAMTFLRTTARETPRRREAAPELPAARRLGVEGATARPTA
jgi:transcriptional regulator with XRE-family HTH domain